MMYVLLLLVVAMLSFSGNSLADGNIPEPKVWSSVEHP
jgi:hypothetical protein